MLSARSEPDLANIALDDHRRFLKALALGRFDYTAIVTHEDFVCDVSAAPRAINVVLGCSGRAPLVETTARYLKDAASHSTLSTVLIISEMGDTPQFCNFAQEHGLEYVFIPRCVTATEGEHSEALVHNLAYFCATRADWYCFHCADILVPADWFSRLAVMLGDQTTFLQPFSEQRLKYLTAQFTHELITRPDIFDLVGFEKLVVEQQLPDHDVFLLPDVPQGTPGGTIIMRADDFERAGGYEPEMFWGWSPEDILLWLKLEFLYIPADTDERRRAISEAWELGIYHLGNATYPDVPTLVFHLHHAPSQPSRQRHVMIDLAVSFSTLPFADKTHYLAVKSAQLLSERAAVQRVLG